MGILDVDKLLGQEPDPLAAAAVNLTQAAGQSPQEHIERRKLSNASGVPAALMDDPEVKERARRDAFARELYLKEHPATAGFAANPNNAPLITDDIINLKDFEDKTRTLAGTASDIGLTALKGVIAMPQAFVGLADIPTGGRIGKALEYIGYKPGEAQDILGGLYSPAQKEANLKVSEAEGVVDTAVAAVQNPSVIAQTVIESLPSMLGGAGLARGGMAGAAKLAPKLTTALSPKLAAALGSLAGSAKVAAALGEGAISAGGAAEQIRGENEDGLLTLRQAATALASGGTTAAFSILGGKVAEKLGIADVDVLLTGKGASAGTKKALGRRVLEGMAAEGILEELPQSATEQMWQNTATGKPVFQGVDQAIVLGAFAGMAMGGGSNIVTRTAKAEQENTALLDTLTAAEASRLKAGLPESFAEFAQRAGDQHGLSAVHLQADKAVEVALGQGLTVEQIMPWLEQYGATAEALDTAIQTGGTIALDYGKVAAGFSNDPTLQALKEDFMVSPSSVSKAMAAEAEQVEEAHLEKLNDLFTKEQDLKIGQEDVQAWTDALLATPGLNGRVTAESLSLLSARANALTALTGKPAIEHLNRMLGPTGLTTMKLKDFRELYGSAGEEIGQPQELGQAGRTLGEIRAAWEARGISNYASEKDGVITLSEIRVPEGQREQGSGSEAMTELISYADQTGQTIALSPSKDFGASSTRRLEAFYKRFGFVKNSGRGKDFSISETMLRRPNPRALSQEDRPFDGPDIAATPLPEGTTTIEVDGVERPALNSEGRAIHPTVEGVKNFWRWFGDSKVVDSEGRPLVVYHGGASGITAFDPAKIGERFGYDTQGFFFTLDNTDALGGAKDYAGDNGEVYSVYLSMPNPYTLDDYIKDIGDTKRNLMYYGGEQQPLISVFDDDREAIIDFANKSGKDGIVFEFTGEDGTKDGLYIAFSPTQIKSATGNRGTFDANDPRILMQQSASTAGATTAAEVAEAQRMWAEMGTESPYFKKWSDDAPLVSRSGAEAYEFKTGEKVVVEALHGTSEALNTFDLARAGKNQPGRLKKERAFFFTSSEDDARFYANYASPGATKETSLGEIIPVYLAFKNPKVVDFSEYEEPVEYNSVLMSDLIQEAQNEGHDGLIIRGMTENLDGEESLADQYVAFSPAQIKSVNNRGTFDPNNPNILMQSDRPFDGPEVAKTPLPEGATTIEVDGVERPALNSEGRAIHPTVEGIKNFWRWFGDSKVVDDQGRPLVVYHGTRADFEVFDPGKWSKNTGADLSILGVYFTEDPFLAGDFSRGKSWHKKGKDKVGSRVIPAYLSIKNPKLLTGKEWTNLNGRSVLSLRDYKEQLQHEGYDGIVVSAWEGKDPTGELHVPQYIAFSPTQIKSATGNRGTFDPAAPSILMQSAWHGSPHTFDKFSTSAIGTGEGAQAYGYGLYFAGNKEVAEWYKEKLSESTWATSAGTLHRFDIVERMLRAMERNGHITRFSSMRQIASNIMDSLEEAKSVKKYLKTYETPSGQYADFYSDAISVLEELDPKPYKGRLYKVELAPEEDEYLLWDKPLSEQSEKVAKAIGPKEAKRLATQWEKATGDKWDFGNFYGQNGHQLYAALSDALGSDKAASEYLHSLGIRGIKYLDGTSRADGKGNYNYVIFSDDDVAITEMFQAQTNDPLGVLAIMGDRNLVNLFEKADKSTFLHETAHIFLNDLKFVAETLGVQTTEWESAKTWLGIGEDGVITRAQHERFAEHFEVYLKNGEAPMPELRSAFRAFKRWLTAVYDNIKASRYGQRAGITISPEIANLFDHLLATDQEIRAAREQAALVALLDDEMLKELSASPEQVDEYRNLSTQADDAAREKRDIHKLKDREELRKGWRKQAEAESFEQPVYGFIQAISKLGGINKQSAIDAFGAENLPDHSTLWRTKGDDINVAIAEHGAEFGYQAPADFIEQLRNLKPRNVWVEQRIAQLETLHDNAQDTQEVIRSTAMRRMLDIESVMLSKKTPGAQAIPAAAIKVWATKTIAGRTIKQINMGLAPLQAQSRRLRQMAILAVRDGRWEDALRFNEQARRTEGLISASMRASKEWTKTKARWKRIAKWTNDNKNVKLGTAFRDQINRLLDQYEIASREYDDAAPDLQSFVALRATGNPLESDGVVLAEWLGVQIGSHANMSWERLQDLDDALKFLYGNGREELEGQRTAKGEFVKEIAGSIANSMNSLKPKRELWSDATAAGRAARAVQQKYRKYTAHTGILRFICQRMDGYAKHGLAQQQNQEIINGMARENDLWASFSAKLEPIITRLTKDGDKVFTDLARPAAFIEHGVNLQWTKKRVVCACLNMGNASNLQRLRDGFALSDADLHALAGKLTASEWQDIQAIWDTINEMWPMIADVHERINHFRPKKIEPQRLRIGTADGQSVSLAGGYYPVGYDISLLGNYDLARWSERDDILNSHENTLQVPVAKSGMTKARADKVSRPLSLSFDVLGKHLHDSLRYIALAEAVRDTDRIFNNKELRAAAYDTIGPDLYGMIRPTLMQILRPNQTELGRYEWLRTKTSVFYMAWNTWTAVQNITGVFPAMFHAGERNYVAGMAHVASDPYRAYKTMLEMSGYMRLRDGNMERDMQSQLKQLASGGLTWKEVEEKFADAGFLGIRAIDTLVSLPAWWGVYNDQLSKNGDIQSAIEAADAAINKALGSGLAIDQTGIGRSMWRLLAPFMSFASTQQEVLRTEKEALMQGKITAAEYLHACLMVWVFPALASTFLSGLMMYGLIGAVGGGDDDDKRKKTVGDYFTDVISYRLMGLPFVRDAWNAYLQGAEHKQPITAARMPFTEFIKMGQQAFYRVGALDGDSEKSQKALAWTLAEMVSYSSGLPVTRAYDRWRRGQEDIENREGWWMNHLVPQERKK